MWSALPPSGLARDTQFVPRRVGRTTQIITLIFILWQPSVGTISYIRGVNLRDTRGW